MTEDKGMAEHHLLAYESVEFALTPSLDSSATIGRLRLLCVYRQTPCPMPNHQIHPENPCAA
jgi:hypothetical protein